MKEFWNAVQFVFTAVGGWLGYFLGGCDGLLFALLAFVVIDYITGVMCAINDQKLSSAVGFKGICRKVLIFLMVGIANILDVYVIGMGSVLRTAAIFFYISNEGISLLENASHLGLPVPAKIKAVLEQLHDRSVLTLQGLRARKVWSSQSSKPEVLMPGFIRTASLKRTIRNVRNADFQREHISMEMPEAWQMQRKRQNTSFPCLRERDTSIRSFMTWKAA